MTKKSEKYNTLIEVAKKLIYKQGFDTTTLSDISLEANVPLGNLYYYFKEKPDIGMAVLNSIAFEQKMLLEAWSKESSPHKRLDAFLKHAEEQQKIIALHGCHIGTLCQELGKKGGKLHHLTAKIMIESLFWLEKQVLELGFEEEASDLSLDLMYRLQGAFLLCYVLKEPKLIVRQVALLQDFIQERMFEKINMLEERHKANA